MIEFEKVTPDHLELLREISLDTFRYSFYHQNTPENYELYVSKALSAETLLAEINNPRSVFYFGYLNQELVCYFKINLDINCYEVYDKASLEIQRIYITPPYLSKGMGSEIMDFIKQYSKDSGYTSIWLGVWEHNPGAIRFYERHGFKLVGKHLFMLGNEEQTDLLMEYKL
jgi:diamine N-acetyltransferase